MLLRTRIMIWLDGLLLVTLLSVVGLVLFTTTHSLRERTKRDALGTASLLASSASAVMTPRPGAAAQHDIRHLIGNVVNTGNLKAVFIVKPDGQLLLPGAGEEGAQAFYRSNLDALAGQVIGTLKSEVRFRGGGIEACVPLAAFGGQAGALVCRLDTRELDDAIRSAFRETAALSFAGLIAGALLAGLLARRISEPIGELARATRVLGAGQFDHRVRVASNDEVGLLADSFNKMADSLEATVGRLAQTTAEKEVLKRDMDIAGEIQRSLLPESCPEIEGIELAAQSVPARDVGGDFYDFIPLPDGRWGLVIADVSGKGVPAALLMALSRSLIRSYSQNRPAVLDALHVANRFLLEDTRSEMFVTCFYAVVDPEARTLTYANAGHNPPLVRRADGAIISLPATGTPLGILDAPGFEEEVCPLGPGDVVLMYTDGMTEAQNAFGEEFGVTRLQEALRNAGHLTAGEIAQRVLTAVNTFAGGQPRFDDMTAVLLKVL